MNSVGDAFSAPFQDSGWFGKIVVQGLIFLIPIIGWISLYGWMMLTIENYRSGRRELPSAGFYLGRGWPIFLVYFIYAIVIAIPGLVLGAAASAGNSGGLNALGNLISLVLRLLLLFLAPAIVLSTYRGGIGGGLDVGGVWRLATANPTNSFMAALVLFAASIIGALGVILCFVGLLFTIPYALAITAGVVVWFEQVSAGPMAAPYPAPPPYTPPAAPAPGSYTPPPPAPPPPGSYTPPPPPPPAPPPPPPPPPAPPPGSYTPPPPPPAPPPPQAPPPPPPQPPPS